MRVTNINEVDLNVFRFDHDLTMAIVLANADGTVYHRYGGREDLSPMSIKGLVSLMQDGLLTHKDYKHAPAPPKPLPPLLLPELAQEQLQGRIAPMFGCYHCHYAREAQQYQALDAGTWSPDQFWIFPDPKRLGLTMDQTKQTTVQAVLPSSVAEAAGITTGDRLLTLNGKRVLTKYDMQWVLDQLDDVDQTLTFTLDREGRDLSESLALKAGWKVGDPADYSWRVRNVYTEHMIKFLPTPGFIGSQLSSQELKSEGLSEGSFALKISELNQGAHLAGVRRGDVVLSAGGRSDFDSLREFYSWCETQRRSGRDLRVRLRRLGSELSLMISLNYLNYSKIERAPRATLGFIVQQLPGQDGLRVGNVTDGCSAEKAGVLVGDRIRSLDGQTVRTASALRSILDNREPGELITLDIMREGTHHQIGFVLSGDEARRSTLARLSEKVTRRGQRLTCEVTIKLPPHKHIYSMHQHGAGVPTQLEFRGRGFRLVGETGEPEPRRIDSEGLAPTWALEGTVTLTQSIEITNPDDFQLLLQVYAQVCDESRCHEFRALIGSDGTDGSFSEYRGHFDRQPPVSNAP